MKSYSNVEVTWLAQRPFLIFGMMILNENFANTERGQTIHEHPCQLVWRLSNLPPFKCLVSINDYARLICDPIKIYVVIDY